MQLLKLFFVCLCATLCASFPNISEQMPNTSNGERNATEPPSATENGENSVNSKISNYHASVTSFSTNTKNWTTVNAEIEIDQMKKTIQLKMGWSVPITITADTIENIEENSLPNRRIKINRKNATPCIIDFPSENDAYKAFQALQMITDSTNENKEQTTDNTANDRQAQDHHGDRNVKRHICTVSTVNYDCQFQKVVLKENEAHTFGHANDNNQQRITFLDSELQIVPKSLIDAFPNMTLLNLNELKIARIGVNVFESARMLEELYFEGNRLETIPIRSLSGTAKLTKLVLSNNQILSIEYDLRDNAHLAYLYVDRNNLRALPSIQQLAKLKEFNANHNQLGSISKHHFSKQEEVEKIDLSHNLLQNLDLSLSSNVLNTLDVSHNQLTNLIVPFSMKKLFVENNSLSTFEIGSECNIEVLSLSHNKLNLANVLNCRSLRNLDLSYNLLESFQFSKDYQKLIYLNVAHNNLLSFEIQAPKRVSYDLASLDLSNNRLSYLLSLSSFNKLQNLRLENNQLVSIKTMPSSVVILYVSYNEWSCNEATKLTQAKDAHKEQCSGEYRSQSGICCRDLKKPFNDVLNGVVKNVEFHKLANYDKQKQKCANVPTFSTTDNVINYREAAKRVDAERGNILIRTEAAKSTKLTLQQDLQNEKIKQSDLNIFKRTMELNIDGKRNNYRVANEGLISDKEKLSRVTKFVEERHNFNKNLLVERVNATGQSAVTYEENVQVKNDLIESNSQQVQIITQLKAKEKVTKKILDTIQKKVNKNAPAIHGSTGRF